MFHVSAPEELESSPPFCFDAYVKVISPLYLSPCVCVALCEWVLLTLGLNLLNLQQMLIITLAEVSS